MSAVAETIRPTVNVSPALREEWKQIADLGRELYRELRYDTFVDYVTDDVMDVLRELSENHLLLTASLDHGIATEVVGFVGMAFVPMYLNRQALWGDELFWFVREDYRGERIGEQLLQMAELYAKNRGCRYVSSRLGDESQAREYLEGRGYKAVESLMMKVF